MLDLTSRLTSAAQLTNAEAARWDGLCAAEPSLGSAFYSRQFVEATAAVRDDVQVCVLYRGTEPVGFLPLQFQDRLARYLRAAERVGGHLNDYFGLIADPSVRVAPRTLLELAGLSKLDFSHLDASQERHGLEGGTPTIGVRYNVADGPGAYWAALKRRDGAFHSDTMRKQRKIERDLGPLRFTYAAADADRSLARLIEMKRQQYARTNVADALRAPWTRELLNRLAKLKHPLCAGVLSTMHAGEKLVSMHFGLRCRDALHIWFPVYDPEVSNYSPGRLLLKSLIDNSTANGIRLLDDGEATPNQQQKRQMGNHEHPLYKGQWVRPGARSFLSRADGALRRRLRALAAAPKA